MTVQNWQDTELTVTSEILQKVSPPIEKLLIHLILERQVSKQTYQTKIMTPTDHRSVSYSISPLEAISGATTKKEITACSKYLRNYSQCKF